MRIFRPGGALTSVDATVASASTSHDRWLGSQMAGGPIDPVIFGVYELNRLHELRTIRREVLRPAEKREHDRRKIARAQLIDGIARDLLRAFHACPARASCTHRP